jgi:serine/threonine protein kinase
MIDPHPDRCDTCSRVPDGMSRAPSEDPLVAAVREADGTETLLPPEAGVPATVAPPEALPPGLAGHRRYSILGCLNVGGMGAVYKALHRVLNQPVALKVIKPDLVNSPDAVARFRREIDAAGRLMHPNIVRAIDAEWTGGCHFLVMEFVEGTDLARLVKRRGPLPVAEACDHARQAAAGLQHASERGMVHRDIKPQNLMLTPEGQVKVLDFGLARFASETMPAAALTETHMIMVTIDYMAPEQARDARAADVRADIYSLGCTLYHLLAGNVPFPGGNPVEKLAAHREQEPGRLSDLRKDVPPGLDRVVRRMMAKDPARRYQTPAEVGEALAPFVDPTPPTPSRRGLVAAAAVWVAVLCLVSVVASRSIGPRPRPTGPNAPSTPGATEQDSAPEPRENLELVLPHRVVVPAGGRSSFEVSVKRTGAAGPIALTAEAVPRGVTLKPRTIPAGEGTVRVVVEANGNVDPGATPVRMVARCGKVQGKGTLDLVLATLRLEVPTSLVIRPGGSRPLPLKVIRGGAEGPVDVRFEGSPRGVTLPELTIPAGTSQAETEVRAGLEAPSGTEEVRVVGTSGPVHGMATTRVTVEEPVPSISGRVFDSISKRPLPGVRVDVVRAMGTTTIATTGPAGTFTAELPGVKRSDLPLQLRFSHQDWAEPLTGPRVTAMGGPEIRCPVDPAGSYIRQGHEMRERKEYDRAVSLFERAIRHNEGDPRAYEGRSRTYMDWAWDDCNTANRFGKINLQNFNMKYPMEFYLFKSKFMPFPKPPDGYNIGDFAWGKYVEAYGSFNARQYDESIKQINVALHLQEFPQAYQLRSYAHWKKAESDDQKAKQHGGKGTIEVRPLPFR